MSDDRKLLLSRRPVIAGLAATTAAALGGIIYDAMSPKHPRVGGPNADLVNQLDDPAAGKIVGAAILKNVANETTSIEAARKFARERLAKETLRDAAVLDVKMGFLTEADGWVLPITVGALSVLATQST